jgi:hypothetical protein
MGETKRVARRLWLYTRMKGWRSRCAHCNRRFLPSHSRHAFGDNHPTYHEVCIGYVRWRGKADERLQVLDLISEVWQVDSGTVQELARNRESEGYKSSGARDRAWRVFYDLKNHRDSKKIHVRDISA